MARGGAGEAVGKPSHFRGTKLSRRRQAAGQEVAVAGQISVADRGRRVHAFGLEPRFDLMVIQKSPRGTPSSILACERDRGNLFNSHLI